MSSSDSFSASNSATKSSGVIAAAAPFLPPNALMRRAHLPA
jgi:hypothetical protein